MKEYLFALISFVTELNSSIFDCTTQGTAVAGAAKFTQQELRNLHSSCWVRKVAELCWVTSRVAEGMELGPFRKEWIQNFACGRPAIVQSKIDWLDWDRNVAMAYSCDEVELGIFVHNDDHIRDGFKNSYGDLEIFPNQEIREEWEAFWVEVRRYLERLNS